jgi:hypothetical protein
MLYRAILIALAISTAIVFTSINDGPANQDYPEETTWSQIKARWA